MVERLTMDNVKVSRDVRDAEVGLVDLMGRYVLS